MIIVLLFLLVVAVIAGRWLSRQGLMSQPWLEVGVGDITEGRDRTALSGAKLGLFVFLAVVGGFFALLVSGYVMRMGYPDWRNTPMPPLLWVNSALLVMGSVLLHNALLSARKGDRATTRLALAVAGVAAFGFLAGQLVVWQQLTDAGLGLTANPANSFFYMLTGIHGLHIVGGLVAWGRTTLAVFGDHPVEQQVTRIELSALYWHFLLFVWALLMVVMLGWADDLVNMCNQLLR
ncbi:cytochrome c oxidase subunit 3 [Candidatus Halocynthiibacter alkanivorans]|uniref:cytochrome c oxidase subunit 3 n=1 Tax=Candidatus Halocynthiibacter alkanivorans TaxID=2267619 RepID=UPI000DF27386|nr:cytochrome c oxidase subunit 3 [Candidatus Halocynthiibacter alkanivorans]